MSQARCLLPERCLIWPDWAIVARLPPCTLTIPASIIRRVSSIVIAGPCTESCLAKLFLVAFAPTRKDQSPLKFVEYPPAQICCGEVPPLEFENLFHKALLISPHSMARKSHPAQPSAVDPGVHLGVPLDVLKTRRKTVRIHACICERCKYAWTAVDKVPVRCSKCKSPYWNQRRKGGR
jgi:hypothetical protein